MGKIIIVYASMTGNTESMAEYIAEGIKETNYEVEVKDSLSVTARDLLEYDGVLLGSYSWDGIPDEIIDLYEELAEVDLSGKKVAVFGSGDTMYDDDYCIAVDKLVEQVQNSGAELVLEALKVELTPEVADIKRCREFGKEFVEKLM